MLLTCLSGNIALLPYEYKEVGGYPTISIHQLYIAEGFCELGIEYYLMRCVFKLAHDA